MLDDQKVMCWLAADNVNTTHPVEMAPLQMRNNLYTTSNDTLTCQRANPLIMTSYHPVHSVMPTQTLRSKHFKLLFGIQCSSMNCALLLSCVAKPSHPTNAWSSNAPRRLSRKRTEFHSSCRFVNLNLVAKRAYAMPFALHNL